MNYLILFYFHIHILKNASKEFYRALAFYYILNYNLLPVPQIIAWLNTIKPHANTYH